MSILVWDSLLKFLNELITERLQIASIILIFVVIVDEVIPHFFFNLKLYCEVIWGDKVNVKDLVFDFQPNVVVVDINLECKCHKHANHWYCESDGFLTGKLLLVRYTCYLRKDDDI